MKKIIFVIADLGMGGAQRVISLLASELAQDTAIKIDIVVMNSGQTSSFFKFPDNIKVHSVGASGVSGGILSALKANFLRIQKLRKIVINLKPDIVISFQTETNCTTLLAMVGAGMPVIVSERSDPYVHPQTKIWRFIRRIVYPLAYGGVFQTAHAAKFFSGIVKNQIVIFNPVTIDNDMSAVPPSGPYILGVGRLSAEKGFDNLIAAHALAVKSCPDLKLVLVGDGPDKSALMQQTYNLGTQDQVVFAGSQKKLANYYRSAMAFVLPSQFEGLPNALLEATAYGCAVVSTPQFAAAPEIITHDHDGLIAEDGSSQALAGAIIRLYDDKNLKTELGNRAAKSAVRFESQKICALWISFIRTQVERKS